MNDQARGSGPVPENENEVKSWEDEAFSLSERLALVSRSRRSWIDAATSVLGPDWNGTPDDLRTALAILRGDPLRTQVTATSPDGWCPHDGGPHQMVIVGGVSRCEKCTTCKEPK